jgi:chaperonin cofactor prefoldin
MNNYKIDELQDEIYKLKETNRILLFQKEYLEQQLSESETARENCKLLDSETFWERHEHMCDKCKRQEENKVPKEIDSAQEKEV